MATQRDYTKYLFEGEKLGKARLVLALVRRHCELTPGLTFAGLQDAFPDQLQADSPTQFSRHKGVVARLNDLKEDGARRYFVEAGETIQLSDAVAAVSREWNVTNIKHLLIRAAELGYEVRTQEEATD